jgi:outer membrane protein
MMKVRPVMLVALALGGLALTAPLAAQAAASSAVVVIDYDRVFKESAAGKNAQAQLKNIDSGIQSELAPETQSIESDQKILGPRLQGKSPEQVVAALKADKELQSKYSAYRQRLQTFDAKRDLRSREMQATAQRALADVLTQAQPSINEAMRARNAAVVLELENTAAHNPDVDITSDVIARFNQRVQTIAVAKVDLTKRP